MAPPTPPRSSPRWSPRATASNASTPPTAGVEPILVSWARPAHSLGRRGDRPMTNPYQASGYTPDRYAFDPVRQPELFDRVLSRRIAAFSVDVILVFVLTLPVVLMLALLGFVTFGLSWFLIGPSFALVALGYVALTLGGPASATIGMRFAGLVMRTWSGAPMFPLLAVMHALGFWFSVA